MLPISSSISRLCLSSQLWISAPAKSWISEAGSKEKEWGFFLTSLLTSLASDTNSLLDPRDWGRSQLWTLGSKNSKGITYKSSGFHYGQELVSGLIEIFQKWFFKEYSLYFKWLGKAVLPSKVKNERHRSSYPAGNGITWLTLINVNGQFHPHTSGKKNLLWIALFSVLMVVKLISS